jgi:hypothetical protein
MGYWTRPYQFQFLSKKLKIKNISPGAGGVAQVVECLLCHHETPEFMIVCCSNKKPQSKNYPNSWEELQTKGQRHKQ